ncbi:MAG: DUF2911 domain-containing protein [Bacteroidota bacterium]|jgi:tetratricopeptide (TPR) repeat protein
MKLKLKTILFFLAITFYGLNLVAQTLKIPAPSPTQTIKQNFALSEITVEYSRPSAKGRVVFGDVVPFGSIWRTGANSSTKITFGEDVKMEGKNVSAGTYAVYTIPNKDSWEIMLYKDLTLGGEVSDYKIENEVARVKVAPSAMPLKTETFTINFADITPTSVKLEMIWETTKVSVNLSSEIDEKVMKNIEAALSPTDKRPYYSAASYYYDNNKDMKQALEWVTKATEINPKAYWVFHLKAKIQLKLKDIDGAIKTAEQSILLAKEDKDDAYVKNNEKLIAEAKKMK